MAVESKWIDIQHFALARKNGEHSLYTVQLLAIPEISRLHYMMQHLDQIREEIQINRMSKSESETFFLFICALFA